MGAIFISHSSVDDAAAGELREWLDGLGHRSVFLDFDPAIGIAAGRQWEQELYARLRACRAVIVLCSPASMASHWCFAEITQAKALGKHVFPARIAPCDVASVLSEYQVIDLAQNRADGLTRLARGLQVAGLDPKDLFQWNPDRPPYPGLLAFQKADTAIYFGREAGIRETLDALNRQRHFDTARLLLIQGASGSGKSSMLRAGVLPRLERDVAQWLVVEPFRPLADPWGELARSLANAFATAGAERDWRTLRSELCRRPGDPQAMGDALAGLCDDLRDLAGQREATTLLAIDQAEELLGRDDEGARVFRPALRHALEAAGGRLMAVATLRTDAFAELQQDPSFRGAVFESLSLGPLLTEDFAQVIEGPARLAGLELEDGLVAAMVADTETENALPMLAFTLRELWERFGADGKLTVEEYREKLGGLDGSIRQAADAVMAHVRTEDDASALRSAFVSMVRINDTGRYARNPARWDDLPRDSHPLIERFVDARLLVSRGGGAERTVEVAHESLFHAWGELRQWLESDREFLLWRRRLGALLAEWETAQRHPDLLLRDARLAGALGWFTEHEGALTALERHYVQESVALRDRELREQERRRRRVNIAIGSVAIVFLVLALVAARQWVEAEVERDVARSRELAARVGSRLASDPELSVLLASEGMTLARGTEAEPRVLEVLRESLLHSSVRALHDARGLLVLDAAFSPDGAEILLAGDDNAAHRWAWSGSRQACPGGRCRLTGHTSPLTSVAYSRDGRHVVTASRDRTAIVHDARSGERLRTLTGHTGHIRDVDFSPDGTLVVTASDDSTARVWRWQAGEGPRLDDAWVLSEHDAEVTSASFTADGRYVITTSKDHTAQIWSVAGRQSEGLLITHPAPINDAASSIRCTRREDPDPVHLTPRDPERPARAASAGCEQPGYLVATGGSDNVARLWWWSPGSRGVEARAVLVGHKDSITSVAMHPHESRIATASRDGTARLWERDAAGGEWRTSQRLLGHRQALHRVAYDATGRFVVTASNDGTARVWAVEGEQSAAVLRAHHGSVRSAEFSHDGRLLVTAGDDNRAFVWARSEGEPEWLALRGALTHDDSVLQARFDRESLRVVTASLDNTAKVWALYDTAGRLRPEFGDATPLVHADDVMDARFSPDGTQIITASDDGTVQLWSASTSERLRLTFEEEEARRPEPLTGDHLSPSGDYLVQASAAATLRVWTTASGLVLRSLGGHGEPVTDIAFSADGRLFATASADGTARTWAWDPEAQDVRALATLAGHRAPLTGVSLSADGRLAVTGSTDETARVWETATGAAASVPLEHCVGLEAVRFAEDGRVVTVGADHVLRSWAWDVPDPEPACAGEAADACVPADCAHLRHASSARFSPDGRYAVSTSADHTVHVYDRRSGDRLQVLRGHDGAVVAAEFSPDGSELATAGNDGRVLVWRWDEAAKVWRDLAASLEHGGAVRSIAFSPDGQRLATGGDDQEVRVWARSAKTGAWSLERSLSGHRDAINRVTFSPDGRWLATASRDRTARIWNVETGAVRAVLPGHTDWVTSASFSPDGELVVTTSRDQTARIWARDPAFRDSGPAPTGCYIPDAERPEYCDLCGSAEVLLALARRCVTRSLTAGERARYLRLAHGVMDRLRALVSGADAGERGTGASTGRR